jgi:hypothetical protein
MRRRGRRCVTARVPGQLGNQLFTYFAAASLAVDQDWGVEIDAFFATRTNHDVSIRHAQLPLLGAIRRNWRYASALCGASRRQGFHQEISRGLERAGLFEVYRPDELGYCGDLSWLRDRNVILDGYFQTYKYVDKVREVLGWRPVDLVRPVKPSEWLQGIQRRARQEQPVVVHMRLGADYHKAGMVFDWSSYLQQAFTESLANDDQPLWLFTDAAREALPLFPPGLRKRVHLVTAPTDTRPIDVLIAMASAHELIMSNSTFSWWAAYLSGHDRITAPAPWFFDETLVVEPGFYASLIPDSWRTLDVT